MPQKNQDLPTEFEPPKLLVWHKPSLQGLFVTVDTAFETKAGSAEDFGGVFDRTVGAETD